MALTAPPKVAMNLITVEVAEPLVGIHYLAFYEDGSTLFAAYYVDGTLQWITSSLGHAGAVTSPINAVGVVQQHPFVVAISCGSGGSAKIVIWESMPNVIHEIATGYVTNFFMTGQGEVFWTRRPNTATFELWKSDTEGNSSQVAHAVSDTLFTDSIPTGWAMLVSATKALEPVYQDDPGSDPSGYVRMTGDSPVLVEDVDFLPFSSAVSEWANWQQGHRVGTGSRAATAYVGGGVNRLALVADGAETQELLAPEIVTGGTLEHWVPSPSGAHAGLHLSNNKIAAYPLSGVTTGLTWFDIDLLTGPNAPPTPAHPMLMVALDEYPEGV